MLSSDTDNIDISEDERKDELHPDICAERHPPSFILVCCSPPPFHLVAEEEVKRTLAF